MKDGVNGVSREAASVGLNISMYLAKSELAETRRFLLFLTVRCRIFKVFVLQ